MKNDVAADQEIWQRVIGGDPSAFEIIVSRYQSAVSAVTYSFLGDFAASEDVSQEAFLVAWQTRESLQDPSRLRAWLCGIARNLAKNDLRRSTRDQQRVLNLAQQVDQSSLRSDQGIDKMARSEEQAIVWSALEAISETYREPLVLYYRDGQSVAAIAQYLEISPDAAKQRLSRGRAMLRNSVMNLVSDVLEHSRPGNAFTAGVMTAIGSVGLSTSAVAATTGKVATGGAVVKTAAKSTTVLAKVSSAGVLGGLLGSVLGLAGAWLGIWLPAQLAETKNEKELYQRLGRRMMFQSVLFALIIAGCSFAFRIPGAGVVAAIVLITTCLWFVANCTVSSIQLSRAVRKLREQRSIEDEINDTKVRAAYDNLRLRYQGRSFQSRRCLLGIPLLDIQTSDIDINPSSDRKGKRAFGWIALGDRADGILFAYGGAARGLIACGGRSVGVISLGGLSFGGIALGGMSCGLISIGGCGLGILVFAGLAVGWQAVGGAAVAWHCASGGAAIAHDIAFGGLAIAKQYAVGGFAQSQQANTQVAHDMVDSQFAKQAIDFYLAHQWPCMILFLLLCMLPNLLIPAMYRRTKSDDTDHKEKG